MMKDNQIVNSLEILDSLWLSNMQSKQLGFVKARDTNTKEIKYFVGLGDGLSEEMDIENICLWGSKLDKNRVLYFFGDKE